MNFFNNNTSQLVITAFCDWFAKLSIEKYQTVSVSGEDIYVQRKVIPVPVCWATREKFIEILRSSASRRAMNPDLQNQVEMQWVLPRIAVNMTGTNYDSQRRIIKTQQIDDIRNSANSKTSAYSPTPYNLEMEVSTISRNIDENFQLLEQIVPYFSPAMNINLKLQENTEPESIKIILNSVTTDNPTDIPENDERLFTNTYNFTIQVNYFIPKKTLGLTNSVIVSMVNGYEVLKLTKSYIESLNVIQDKFTQYVDNSITANPFLYARTTIPVGNISTYTPGQSEDETFLTNALSALDDPQVVATQGVSGITLTTPGISAMPSLADNIKIYYRIDDENTIYEYTNEIPITFSKIYYWINLTTKVDSMQLIVYQYVVV